MASSGKTNEIPVIIPNVHPIHELVVSDHEENNASNISQRAQLVRAAVLGANDGLVSVASLMMGVGAVKQDMRAMLLAGFAGVVAGACSMGIGEFVSVYTQLDIELAHKKKKRERNNNNDTSNINDDDKLISSPNPFEAAIASTIAFGVGGVVPLVGGVWIKDDYKVRMSVIVGVSSLALIVFGGIGAKLGNTSLIRSCFRFLIGGWMAMAITFGLTKFIGFSHL